MMLSIEAVKTYYLRSLREMYDLRNQTLIAPIIVPAFVLLVFSGLYSEVFARVQFVDERIPGFGKSASYVQYFIAAPLVMASFWGTSSAGIGVAVERQIGFYDRLAVSPLGTMPSQIGRRLADGTRIGGFIVILSFFGAVSGLSVPHWPLALGVTIPLTVTLGMAYGGLAYSLCVRTGSAESTQAVTPIFLPFLFTSTAFIPLELAPTWLQPVMAFNPLSPICETIRNAYSGKVNVHSLVCSLVVILALGVVSQTLIYRAERKVSSQ